MIRLLMVIILTGCASKVDTQHLDMYGPDYYEVHCINGQLFIISEHGQFKLYDTCLGEQ